MALMCKQSVLSDNQLLPLSGDNFSENIFDFGEPKTPVMGNPLKIDHGRSKIVPFLIQITEDFTEITTLDVHLEVDNDPAFPSPTKVYTHQFMTAADLVAGSRAPLRILPHGLKGRYMRARYVTPGATTHGRITTGATRGNQETEPYDGVL